MIKLKEIEKKENQITCNAFVEDCNTAIPMKYNISKGVFSDCSLPVDYKWCKMHLIYAKRFVESLALKDNIPRERLIMWY
ncbi:MAG: hypothetical protein K5894_05765 [Lachnospiraceae bacterium]|nr:hypothetical protein [Lachnospiraceae bacterium]